jgi:glycosyltransferase involved in cell wall biosynthesis
MKICLINNLYEPYNRGGAGEVVKNIITGLKNAGHDVFLITVGKMKKLENENQKSGNDYKIYYIKPWNIFSYIDINNKPIFLRLIWWFFNIFNFSGRNQIKNILETEKPDVVMTHNLVGISFLVPGLLKKMSLRHVHTLHDIQLSYPSGQLIWGKEKNFINTFFLRVGYEKLARKLFGSPDVVVSPSKWLLNFYTERGFFGKSNKVVLANLVVLCHSREGGNPEETVPGSRVSARDDKGKTNFLFVGTIEEYKGILFLIETFKKISGDFILKIVGDGRDLEKAKGLAAGDNRFEFLGRKNKIELAEIYKSSDCLILPTLTYENLPTVILESFSFGVPVIASKIGGIPELVEENRNGWLFEPGNDEELKRKIEALLSKPEEIDRMRKECLEKAKEFEIKNYIDKLIKLI